MSRSDPTISVACDRCDVYEEDDVHLTPLALKSWDMRGVDSSLRRRGWRVENGEDICPDCVEEEK